jgi:hypothetical protein
MDDLDREMISGTWGGEPGEETPQGRDLRVSSAAPGSPWRDAEGRIVVSRPLGDRENTSPPLPLLGFRPQTLDCVPLPATGAPPPPAMRDPNHPRKGCRYRHFRGAEYRVVGFSRDSETRELRVLYMPWDKTPAVPWDRPLDNWREWVQHEGSWVLRFQPLEEESVLGSETNG